MTETSQRLIEQRLRNRIMEALAILGEGDAGVQAVGWAEYFEGYYDLVPHRSHGGPFPNSALSAEEILAISEVSKFLDAACDDTPRDLTDDVLIETGWPRRIQPVAMHALALMNARGCFSEEQEEAKPSMPGFEL